MNSRRNYITIISLLIIIIITIGIVINYPSLLILYEAYTNPHSIKVFFFRGLTPIQNL